MSDFAELDIFIVPRAETPTIVRQPDDKPGAGYQLDYETIAGLLRPYGIDQSAFQSLGIEFSKLDIKKEIGRFNSFGFVRDEGRESIHYTPGITLDDSREYNLHEYNQTLLHEIGHLVDAVQKRNSWTALYNRERFLLRLRNVGRYATAVGSALMVGGTMEYHANGMTPANVMFDTAGFYMACVGAWAATSPRNLAWNLDRGEWFAERFRLANRNVQLLNMIDNADQAGHTNK